MERLTKRDFSGRVMLRDSMGWDAIKKLADYEDTGLDPEQVLLEVVRCKDCKNAYSDEMFEGLWCRGRKMKPHDFCSCGERRGE